MQGHLRGSSVQDGHHHKVLIPEFEFDLVVVVGARHVDFVHAAITQPQLQEILAFFLEHAIKGSFLNMKAGSVIDGKGEVEVINNKYGWLDPDESWL